MASEVVKDLIKRLGHEQRDEPFELASGEFSRDYIDGKFSIASGQNLRLVAEEIINVVEEPFSAVGGLTMGADALSHAVSLIRPDTSWFSVRKHPKSHGRQAYIEGARLEDGEAVLLVDDVVTTGESILQAYDAVKATGADIVWVTTLVDRGDTATETFRRLAVSYTPLVSYKDLGIDRVGEAAVTTTP